MEYWAARSAVSALTEPMNGSEINEYTRKAIAVVLEYADRYADLNDEDAIRDCTREQPHDGPCNGWPCPYVKALPCPRGCGQTIGECLQNDCYGEKG